MPWALKQVAIHTGMRKIVVHGLELGKDGQEWPLVSINLVPTKAYTSSALAADQCDLATHPD